jgi:hypothetical protein
MVKFSHLRVRDKQYIFNQHIRGGHYKNKLTVTEFAAIMRSIMITLQSVFVSLVMLLLCALVLDGIMTRSVWVKGSRTGLFSFRNLAYKCDREYEPRCYWSAMVFYGVAMLLLIWLLLSEATI